jgi:hypothetical protein
MAKENIWVDPLGVVKLKYKGLDLGKTTADTELTIDMDIKDIIYQQDGTKYADKVRTGQAIMINATFGEIKTSLLAKLQPGFTASGDGNSMILSRSLYNSMKDNECGILLVTRVDQYGNEETSVRHRIKFFKAAAEITGPVQWGADTQRNVPVTFHCFWDNAKRAFGFSGNESSLSFT